MNTSSARCRAGACVVGYLSLPGDRSIGKPTTRFVRDTTRLSREVLRPQSPAPVVASVSGVAELVPGGGRAGDATLVGAQVAGVRVTLTSGFVVIFGRFMDILHYP